MSKFRRYMLYAIGEIILIVIGLFLAIQLNNLNTSRIQKNELDKSLVDLQNELARKKNYIKLIDLGFTYRDSIYVMYLDGKLEKEFFLKTNFPSMLRRFTIPITMSNENIPKVLSREHLMDGEHQIILQCLKDYLFRLENYMSSTEKSNQIGTSNVQYLADNFNWFLLEDSTDYQKMADFFVRNKIIRNKIYLHSGAASNEYFEFSGLYSINIMLYAYIGLLNETIQENELDSIFQSFGYSPMEMIDCQETYQTQTSILLSTYMHLFYNASDDSVTINRLNDDLSIIESFTIASKGYQVFGNRPGRLFEVQKQDSCRRFVARRKGYLLIE